ncbi:MAG: hypothetical protein ACLT1K_11770 [[Clostridium] leptum]
MGAECESLLPEKGGGKQTRSPGAAGTSRGMPRLVRRKEKRRIGSAYEEEAVWRLTERF